MYVLLYEYVYVCTYVIVLMYMRDPVRLRLRHLYQVELCSFILRYPQGGHPCTVDTFLVFVKVNPCPAEPGYTLPLQTV